MTLTAASTRRSRQVSNRSSRHSASVSASTCRLEVERAALVQPPPEAACSVVRCLRVEPERARRRRQACDAGGVVARTRADEARRLDEAEAARRRAPPPCTARPARADVQCMLSMLCMHTVQYDPAQYESALYMRVHARAFIADFHHQAVSNSALYHAHTPGRGRRRDCRCRGTGAAPRRAPHAAWPRRSAPAARRGPRSHCSRP